MNLTRVNMMKKELDISSNNSIGSIKDVKGNESNDNNENNENKGNRANIESRAWYSEEKLNYVC
jgi:hypothetical protein